MATLLPSSPRLRGAVMAAATVIALLVITQFVLPGTQGGGRGTPGAILFSGLVYGLQVALSAVGIVMLYRTLRFINFGLIPLGIVGAVLVIQFVLFTQVPFLLAFLLGVLLCAALGAVVGVFTLRFFNSSRLFLTVVTIVGANVFFSLLNFIIRLPFFPPLEERTSGSQNLGPEAFRLLLPFAGFDFQVGKFPLQFGFAHVFALEIAIITLLAIGAFFRYTRMGTAVRALAENPERASLLGIGVGSLSIVIWTIVGALAGVTAILAVVLSSGGGGGGDPDSAFGLLLPILTAAVIARMASFPTAIFTAVVLGVLQQAFNFSYRNNTQVFNVLLFVVVAVGLLLQRRRMGRSEAGGGTTWAATEEPRPVPKELAHVTPLRVARISFIVVAVVAIVAFPFVATTGRVVLAGTVAINAIAVLSLVVLTGWAGQVSLGQYAFVGIGSVVGGSLTSRLGLPFWLALPVGAAITGALAVVVGLPALRIRGLFLLVTTFGFAVTVQAVLFDERYFGWLLPTEVDRPVLFFLDFNEERSMYFLCVAALVLSLVVVRNLRRSRVGRLLISVRENEPNLQSFGVSAVRAKLLAFAISGALAGFAGVIFAHQQRGVAAESFTAFASVNVFVQAVIGGVSSGGGALLGSAYFVLTTQFLGSNVILSAFVGGLGPLLILFLAPGGLISLINRGRDSVLRIVAQRRQIVVPSLFADYDASALEKRLIPLAEPDMTSGLAALPLDHRFSLASELYQGRGERIIDKLAPPTEDAETAALGAAGRAAEEAELESVLQGQEAT